MFPALAVTALVSFAAGVAFHKYVLSEAAAIKAHVTAEVAKVREDLKEAVAHAAQKL